MKVVSAEAMGFCYGVKRAVDLTLSAAAKGDKIVTFGPLIHNPQMIEKLALQGVSAIHSLDEAHDKCVVIRSHGAGPTLYDSAQAQNIPIIDATCPHVKKVQQAAQKLCDQGMQVVIVGEANHPEVQSVLEWAGPGAIVVESVDDANKLGHFDCLGVAAQTTLSLEHFEKVVLALREHADQITVERTICRATDERQSAARALAQRVDVMVVVGGRNSANTRHLSDVCREVNPRTYQLETAAELRPEWFSGVAEAGITAGASTPDWIIEEVRKTMQEMEKGSIVAGKVVGVRKDEVFVDIGGKSEGIVTLAELAWPAPADAHDVVQEGQLINVLVLNPDPSEGSIMLSKIQADRITAWDNLEEALAEERKIEGVVTAAVKGGLSISVFGVRGFIPASQIDTSFVEDLTTYVGKTLTITPMEVDREKQRVVLSRRVLLEAERKVSEAAAITRLIPGQTVKGTVKRLASFGAFVDVGGIDGLIHISDLAWYRVKDTAEILTVGDEIEVAVLKVDPETRKVSLSLKQLQQDPWHATVLAMGEGSVVPGKVTKTSKFGAFVEIAPGVEGLVHLSELSDKRVATVEEVVHAGQKVSVKILSIEPANKRISLSIIKAKEDADRADFVEYLGSSAGESLGATIGDKLGHLFKKAN